MLYIACAVLWLLRFALGASIFSFLGVVIWRLPRGESVVKGRSHCPACGRTLSAAELVPCLAFMDIDTLEIYDRFPALLLVCGAAAQFVFPGPGIKSRLLGCVIVSLPMLLLALVVPGGFGGGDIKLMFGAGFFLGAKLTVVAAFIGILLGGGFGALLLAQKKANRKSQFAFGPFLCIGIAIAMFFGETIADWYMGLL